MAQTKPRDPCSLLTCLALQYICQKDPSWETAQPRDFKALAVECLKKAIQCEVLPTGTLRWSLTLDGQTIAVEAPLFRAPNLRFNPYH